MKNLRHLTRPSPTDFNLLVGSDALGMLRQGSNLDVFYHYKGNSAGKINNGTGDQFNHFIGNSLGLENHVSSSKNMGGVSVSNALLDGEEAPIRIVDKPKAKQLNPLSKK